MVYNLENVKSNLPTVTISYIGFAALFYLLLKFEKIPKSIKDLPSPEQRIQKTLYIANYVALVHALIVFTLSVIAAYINGFSRYKYNDSIENANAAISLGYFLNDTISGFYFNYNDMMTHTHHIIGLLMLPYSLWTRKYGNMVCWIYIIGEISNPFILMRNNLEKHPGFKFLKFVCGLLFCLLFMSMRVIGGGILAYLIYNSGIVMLVKGLFALLWFLSLLWSFKVLNFFLKYFAEKNSYGLIGSMYRVVDSVRRNPMRFKVFVVSMAALAFMPPLGFWNHEKLM